MQNTHSILTIEKPKVERSSNLELYRIVCMLLIIAHHFVVNSGLTSVDGVMMTNPTNVKTLFLWMFGMWGKTGINCFLLITGYFMCKSEITIKKFVKFLLQIYLYKFVIFTIFLLTGYEAISFERIVKLFMPVWGINSNFMGCFLVFYLTIPFWNILIRNMTQKQHQLLLLLLLTVYTVLGSVPTFAVSFNYVTWFGIIYLIASYIRLYPQKIYENRRLWGGVTMSSIALAICSMLVMQFFVGNHAQYFVSDSNKFFAVVVAVSSFLWFKNLDIRYSKIINTLGAATFGVLLIHANSNAMRTWLWRDMVDCVGHYALPLWQLVLYSMGVVIVVFILCSLIDIFRAKYLEPKYMVYIERKFNIK